MRLKIEVANHATKFKNRQRVLRGELLYDWQNHQVPVNAELRVLVLARPRNLNLGRLPSVDGLTAERQFLIKHP